MKSISLLCGLLCLVAGSALAQVSGMSKLSGDKPIEITADTLEVYQEKNQAIFVGNVVAIQGTMRLKSNKMVVHYNQTDSEKSAAQSDAIKKIEVDGNVFLSTPEETASGASGEYDVAAKKIYLNTNVVLTREKNTLKGDHLVYDMATGKSVVKSGGVAQDGKTSGGRVRALFVPDKDKK